MPQTIQHIDAIARQKNRAVLFLHFHKYSDQRIDWTNLPIRKAIIAWFDENEIAWLPCGDYANENVMLPYLGQIYIDIPFVESDENYQKLRDYLEYPDGKIRFEGVHFSYTTPEAAMKNVHHDEPGFWEKWAENL